MRASIPLYEGDSIIHYAGSAAAPSTRPRGAAPAISTPWTAAKAAIAGFFHWLERGAERARYRELERYLGEATDVCDLERRIRQVEQSRSNMFDPYS